MLIPETPTCTPGKRERGEREIGRLVTFTEKYNVIAEGKGGQAFSVKSPMVNLLARAGHGQLILLLYKALKKTYTCKWTGGLCSNKTFFFFFLQKQLVGFGSQATVCPTPVLLWGWKVQTVHCYFLTQNQLQHLLNAWEVPFKPNLTGTF